MLNIVIQQNNNQQVGNEALCNHINITDKEHPYNNYCPKGYQLPQVECLTDRSMRLKTHIQSSNNLTQTYSNH